MSRHTARTVLEQMNLQPCLLAQRYAMQVPLPEVNSGGLLGDLRELATCNPIVQEEQAKANRRQVAMAYGVNDYAETSKPFMFMNGKAIIPIHGVLINRFAYSWSFVTGYNFIRAQVDAALADDDVDGIIYDVNSPGGMVAGCRETSEMMRASSAKGGGKSSLAVVDSNCYSAAYMLACAADRIAVTPTGGAGSIGVLMMHMDVSGALDKFGVKVSFIFSGKHKVDGNMFEPLPQDVRDRLQVESDKIYDDFVNTVTDNRSMTEQAVRDTEALCYFAEDARNIGLIDVVATPPDAMNQFFNATDPEEDENEPSEDHNPEDELDNEDPEDDDLENDRRQNVAAAPQQTNAPKPNEATSTGPTAAEAAATARTNERARISAIQNHAEAEGRTSLANHLAMETDLSVDAAAAILKASPKQVAAAPATTETEPKKEVTTQETNHFQNAMDKDKHPNVGAGGEGGSGEKASRAQQMLAAQGKAHGVKVIEGKAA